jgi:threonine synthase
MASFVSHLESAIDHSRHLAGQLQTMHKDRPLLVRYDLPAIAYSVSRDELRSRPATMWRYSELLPTGSGGNVVSLGETMTPLVPAPRLAARYGLNTLWIKDESRLPTGSFKARGLAMAVNMAVRLGVRRVAIPTAGNAGGAAASYAARAGIEAFVFMPDDTPATHQNECRLAGARTFLVNGLINDCGRIVREGKEPMGWFDLSTMKEPYRIEGKKTMGLELAEQFTWQLPDVIVYPTGGGTGLVGMWKGFQELRELGWLSTDRLPRMVAVQSTGCCPIATAFERGERFATPFDNASTIASGLRVPVAVGDFLILDAVRQSEGCALAVDEASLPRWMAEAASLEGLSAGPESAACVGAVEVLSQRGWLRPEERIVIFNTAAAHKYVEAASAPLPRLDVSQPLDWQWIARGGAA